MEIFDTMQQSTQYSHNIPVITPALRWAQSLHNIFIEVKFATRWDSPACLDISDHSIILEDKQNLVVSAMCKSDGRLLKYHLNLTLHDSIQPFQWSQDDLDL